MKNTILLSTVAAFTLVSGMAFAAEAPKAETPKTPVVAVKTEVVKPEGKTEVKTEVKSEVKAETPVATPTHPTSEKVVAKETIKTETK